MCGEKGAVRKYSGAWKLCLRSELSIKGVFDLTLLSHLGSSSLKRMIRRDMEGYLPTPLMSLEEKKKICRT